MKKLLLCIASILICLLFTSCKPSMPKITLVEMPPDESDNNQSDNQPDIYLSKNIPAEYQDYYNINPDLSSWLKIENLIDMPIVQTDDNNTYLTKNFDNSIVSYSTAAFLDYNIKPDSQVKIIYGHNLLSGEAFAPIAKYYPKNHIDDNTALSFLQNNAVINYYDFYTGNAKYIIFAGICITTDPSDSYYIDISDLFKTNNKLEYHTVFDTLIPEILDRSVFYNNSVQISPDDKILILSTCIDLLNNKHETRFLLFAKQIDSPVAINIELNPNPLYFDDYYDYYNISWPGRQWNPDLIKF